MGKIFLASLLGAIACLIWGGVSWFVLQWHGNSLQKFSNEADVASVISANADRSGVYMLPSVTGGMEHTPKDEAAATRKSAALALKNGPFVYSIVRIGNRNVSLWINVGYSFLRSFVACFIIALMLAWTVRLDYIQRVFFCALAGLFAGLVSDVPMMIWFEEPVHHALISMAGHLCEWFLAGLIIAALVPGSELWEKMR